MPGVLLSLIADRAEMDARLVARLHASSAAQSLDSATTLDSLHELLDEIADALRANDLDARRRRPSSVAAVSHGEQRFHLGYDFATFVREYVLLQEVIFDLAQERGLTPSVHEVRTVVLTISDAIVDGSVRYAQMRDEMQQRQASQHIGFLAHEVRDPLSTALLGVEIVRRQAGSSRALDAVARNLARINQLIDDVLVDVRLRGAGDLRLEPVDVHDLVQSVVEESCVAARSKEIEVTVESPPQLGFEADARVLRSAVSNLVRNAVKFSQPNGSVVVRAIDASDRIRIEVEDSCGGLPQGAVEKVFDPYVQAGKDKSGFGMGLAIAKQAALAHDGAIRVHDLPGKGCVFVLDLPRHRLPQPSQDAHGGSDRPS